MGENVDTIHLIEEHDDSTGIRRSSVQFNASAPCGEWFDNKDQELIWATFNCRAPIDLKNHPCWVRRVFKPTSDVAVGCFVGEWDGIDDNNNRLVWRYKKTLFLNHATREWMSPPDDYELV